MSKRIPISVSKKENACPRCGAMSMRKRVNRKGTGEVLRLFRHKGDCSYKVVESRIKAGMLRMMKIRKKALKETGGDHARQLTKNLGGHD